MGDPVMTRNRADGLSDRSDEQLLALLREGDSDAYTELWRRHIEAARRLSRRLIPNRADDLASESFLAVYHQITVKGNGPEQAFRGYLFTTIRNTAARWRRESDLVQPDSDLDLIDPEDPLSILEDRARSAELLTAFQALPDRWQRVLWLTEIEGTKRPRVAAELGIRPNAVSALHRRAREGLRLQWLTQKVPPRLRDDRTHAARLLPHLVLEYGAVIPAGPAGNHLEQCLECMELHAELVSSAKRMRGKTLAATGIAALGVVLPAAAKVSIATVGVGAAAAILAVGSITIASTLGFVATSSHEASPGPRTSTSSSQSSSHTSGDRGSTGEDPRPSPGRDAANRGASERSDALFSEPIADAIDPLPTGPQLGRRNTDPNVSGIDLDPSAPPNLSFVPATPQAPAPHGSVPPAQQDSSSALRSGLSTPAYSAGYLAPQMTGTTQPGASVAIEIQRPAGYSGTPGSTDQFLATADATGAWSFDLRAVASTAVGTYAYSVWAFTETETSPADSGEFLLSEPELLGFESLIAEGALPIAEASSSGIVFEVRGPANGTICFVSEYPGQAVEIPLDASGSAVKRIRFLAAGTYYLTAKACEGSHHGPVSSVFVDVWDPDTVIATPFGPDPWGTAFELSDP